MCAISISLPAIFLFPLCLLQMYEGQLGNIRYSLALELCYLLALHATPSSRPIAFYEASWRGALSLSAFGWSISSAAVAATSQRRA